MESYAISDDIIQGHVSLERGEGWVKPWRLPHQRRSLFPSPEEGLLGRAECTSGVRLRFATEASAIRLRFLPLSDVPDSCGRDAFHFDLTAAGKRVGEASAAPGSEEALFTDLPSSEKVVEIWLLPEVPVTLLGLEADAPCRPLEDTRPRWVTYGSSLTHCVRAHSPARTWPTIVARKRGLHLTNLGFGGQCHLDAMVGIVIRDLPADVITLKLGINTIISGTLAARTYPAAIVALVQIIREKHPDIPMALISPIGYPPRETEPNAVGYTISDMRRDMEAVHDRLVALGDKNLIYVNGLEVFDLDLIPRYAKDQCHPDADGIEIQADNFDHAVMDRLL
jgi:hypothetical protein